MKSTHSLQLKLVRYCEVAKRKHTFSSQRVPAPGLNCRRTQNIACSKRNVGGTGYSQRGIQPCDKSFSTSISQCGRRTPCMIHLIQLYLHLPAYTPLLLCSCYIFINISLNELNNLFYSPLDLLLLNRPTSRKQLKRNIQHKP